MRSGENNHKLVKKLVNNIWKWHRHIC